MPATDQEFLEWMADKQEQMNTALMSGNPTERTRFRSHHRRHQEFSTSNDATFDDHQHGHELITHHAHICGQKKQVRVARGEWGKHQTRAQSSEDCGEEVPMTLHGWWRERWRSRKTTKMSLSALVTPQPESFAPTWMDSPEPNGIPLSTLVVVIPDSESRVCAISRSQMSCFLNKIWKALCHRPASTRFR